MIILTKLNGVEFAINSDLIEMVEENPDTTIRMTNKSFHIVRETKEEIIDLIVDFRRRCSGRIFRDEELIKE